MIKSGSMLELRATERTTKTQGDRNAVRAERKIPGVIYGHGVTSQTVTLDYQEFEKLYAKAGESSLVNLIVDTASPRPVLISDVQKDPVRGSFIHVDLHQVRMDEKIKAHIALQIVGESPAVKGLGANLIISKDELEVECLPKDLVAQITVDISVLTEMDQGLRVRDLNIPAGITVLDEAEETIVSALKPREEKVEEVKPETVEAEVTTAKKEGEEGEGDAAAAGQSGGKEKQPAAK